MPELPILWTGPPAVSVRFSRRTDRCWGSSATVASLSCQVSGGQTSQVKDVSFGLGRAGRPGWTPDGRIIYTSERGALVMVHSDGTSSEQLTSPGPRAHEIFAHCASRRPHVTVHRGFWERQRGPHRGALYRSTTMRPLISGGALTPQYADGFLFYCRPNGTLMAVSFDAARVEITGKERRSFRPRRSFKVRYCTLFDGS